ncbi:MAG: Major Facilitator Superfamily [Lasallia pustulata]|uniref:Major Facilitator Superfamily n=1 Tax=Lasallia pustulata TaxID=136370 RepID=A0A5M8PMI8_9LECA|nr:MAG: Major Facilitator Superfamily [Lasallia pustulata]
MDAMYDTAVLPDESATKYRSLEDNLGEPLDRLAETKLRWKCDLHVLPAITVLYLLAFIDRVNIGNARIQGLEKDLKMKGHDYNVALFVFFIPYILFEVPSNILLRKIAPSTWLSSIMFCWGVVTVCQGVIQSYAGLIVCRFLLGLFEAGFVPGCIYLISMYYQRYELQWRINLFFCAGILSGAFGGLLAFALANMAGVAGYNGWRWIFIIEGLGTVVIAAVSKFFIVDWPETSKFLNDDERHLLLRRLRIDVAEAKMDRLDKKAARRIFGDWKIYAGITMYFGVVNTGYSILFFTPTILKALGWTSIRAQVLSIPIYIVSCSFTLLAAFTADRLRHRYAFTMIGVLVATVGYSILLAQQRVPVSARYLAVYLITVGGYITQPVTLVWLNNNMGGHYKRSVSSALQVGIGNCGGIVASNIYITSQAPTYRVGYAVGLGLLWLCGMACTVFFVGLRMENKKRNNGGRDDRYSLPEEELENLGDDHPRFRFGY